MTLENEFIDLCNNLFQIKIEQSGASNINNNVDDMILFNWNKLNLNIIKKYNLIYLQLINNITKNYSSTILNNDIICNIILFLPESYISLKNNIINKWIYNYNTILQNYFKEDDYDLNWYQPCTIDYNWAKNRMKCNIEITNKINNYQKIVSKENSLIKFDH